MSLASASTTPSAALARAEAIGYLALAYTGKRLTLQVRHSAAGHYIGTRDTEGPVSRESREYFRSHAAAQRALERGGWSQLATP